MGRLTLAQMAKYLDHVIEIDMDFKAETEGFEPSRRNKPTNAFRVRRVMTTSLRLQFLTINSFEKNPSPFK